MFISKPIRTFLFLGLALAVSSFSATAQDQAGSAAAPEGMPPEIAQLFDDAEASGAAVSVATSEAPADLEPASPGAMVGSRYLYTTLRVINNSAPRGCGYADWNCMTRLCRSDLRDSAAWRGWAGCWRRNAWICYFECGQRRDAF